MKQVNVNFSDEVYQELERIAATKHQTLSEVLTDAVTLEKYVADARSSGSKIFVQKPDGSFYELLLR